MDAICFPCILTLSPDDWSTGTYSVETSVELRVQDMSLLVFSLLAINGVQDRGLDPHAELQGFVSFVVRTGTRWY